MGVLNKADILKRDARLTPIDSKVWGGQVYLRKFSAAEGRKLASVGGSDATDQGMNAIVYAFMFAVCDKDGARLFSDDDLEEVQGLPFDEVKRIAEEALDFNGMTGDAEGN